jgi:hypothetical protein
LLKSAGVAVFLLSLAWAGPAGGGSCRGEGEKTVLYLEYLARQANVLLDRLFWAANLAPVLRRHAPQLARMLFALRARQILARELPRAAEAKDHLPDQLVDFILPVYQQACEALGTKPGEEVPGFLSQTVASTAEGYYFCQAAAERKEHWCSLLSDSKNRRDCPRFLSSFRLLSGDCSRQAVEEFSRHWGAPPEVMQPFCQALHTRQKELCPQGEPAVALCRALAERSEEACRQGDEKSQKICQQLLSSLSWLEGKAPLPQLTADDPYPWMVRGWLEPESCLEAALSWWERSAGFPLSFSVEQPVQ